MPCQVRSSRITSCQTWHRKARCQAAVTFSRKPLDRGEWSTSVSISVGNIIRFDVTWLDTRFSNVIKNTLNFRCVSGEAPIEMQPLIIEAFTLDWLQPWRQNLASTTYVRRVKITNVSRENDPSDEKLYDVVQYAGTLTSGGEETPQAAACIVRQAYSRGRKSIGRVFFGPLVDRFCNAGRVVVNPLSDGDLTTVCEALGAPIEAEGVKLNPIVVGAGVKASTQQMEVRSNRVSDLVVYLQSRRPGIGE